MVIYKFGGASVKNAEAFQYLRNIVYACQEPLIVVVSAMGKTTNLLEEIVKLASKGSENYRVKLKNLRDYHLEVLNELVHDPADLICLEIEKKFREIEDSIGKFAAEEFNMFYDQVVSMGEVISTLIVSRFLKLQGIDNVWLDIRELLLTDENYRDAVVDFGESGERIRKAVQSISSGIIVTQGFIGAARNGNTTTLGREGSDFSAAALANILNAEQVILWKDVDGIFNADPAISGNVTLLEKVSYQEMIELAYYGAKVIHPKTIKPLRQKQIPLYVKSFYDPVRNGTSIGEYSDGQRKVPITIIKGNQVLISISLSDLSFVSEFHISKLFGLLNRFRLKANMMQHSAVSFSVSVDEPRGREVEDLIAILSKEFKVLYNEKLTLTTIRHYTEDSITSAISGKQVFVEQRSRNTVQYLTA